MKVLVIFSVFLTAVVAKSVPSDWTIFKENYNKEFNDLAEDSESEVIFIANKEAFEEGKVLNRKTLYEFADMTVTEPDRVHNGYKTDFGKIARNRRSVTSKSLPSEVDWRKRGAVTSVKDQGSCGSCYAFSVIGAIEGQYFLETGRLLSFSEQQVVDCSKNFGTYGCEGGEPSSVFQYLVSSGGLETDRSYLYDGIHDGECLFKEEYSEAFVENFESVKESEKALMIAVTTIAQ
jgi:cathepsin L